MKTRLAALLCLALASFAPAQEPAAAPTAIDGSRLTADQLDQLLGPIALYPDALIALILPAATAPADIVLAARYLKDDGNPATVADRAWDESVKSLVHYPAVIKWLDENLAWTKQLGEAFAQQPAAVMQAIQRLRATARAAGTLVDSPQQTVLAENGTLLIVPAQPNVIYVPYYDSAVVYGPSRQYYRNTSFIGFSAAYEVGPWLGFDCDWPRGVVWIAGPRHRFEEHRDWRRPALPGQPGYVNDPDRRQWRPTNSITHAPAGGPGRHDDPPHPGPNNFTPRPTVTHDSTSDHHKDAPARPSRDDGRNRDPNPGRSFASPPAPTATPPPNVSSAPTPQPTLLRRPDSGHGRVDSGDHAGRAVIVQNPPMGRPTGPAPVAPPAPTVTPTPVATPPPAQSDDRHRAVPDGDQKKQQAS